MRAIKVLSTIVILAILAVILYGASKAFTGNYIVMNPSNAILIAAAAIASTIGARYLIKILWKVDE